MLNFEWAKGHSQRSGFNFGFGFSTRKDMTLFRFGFLLPIWGAVEGVFIDPCTKNICLGYWKRYFTLYFRLRRSWKDPIDFIVGVFDCPTPVRTLVKWEDV